MKRILGLLAFAGLLLALSGCATFTAATPDEEGEIRIDLTEYDFDPNTIRVKAGQKVTLVVSNQGDKMHEIMIGRDINIEGNLTEGFHEDFFAGITPEIHGPGMVMGLEGGDMEHDMEAMAGDEMDHDMDEMAEGEMTEMDQDEMVEGEMEEMDHDMDEMAEGDMDEMAPDEMAEGDMAEMDHDMDEMAEGDMEEMDQDMTAEGDMEEMDHDMDTMAEDDMAEMEPDEMAEGDMAEMEHDMDTMAEGEMAGMEHDMVETSFGALQRPLMDAHAGLMVMFDPTMIPSNEVTTITFTVPEDKVGEWELGCFQEQGQHYDDGMRGTLIVEPSS